MAQKRLHKLVYMSIWFWMDILQIGTQILFSKDGTNKVRFPVKSRLNLPYMTTEHGVISILGVYLFVSPPRRLQVGSSSSYTHLTL